MSFDNLSEREVRELLKRENKKKDFKLSNLRAKKKIYPYQPGAKKLREKYGDRLYCVRYRYDKKRRLRYTTVELIIDKAPRNQIDNLNAPFPVRIMRTEKELRCKLLQGGAYWDAENKCYFATLWLLDSLGIADRILEFDGQY
ncbi:MAG: hypothetical protein JXR83_21160 [Deltaproteobacteria bacterium]|nr:hypothetical protein [Deltaproteobacteria bacterium]